MSVTVLPVPPLPPAASVRDVELAGPIPDLDPADGPRAWLVVRLHTEPLGLVVVDVPPTGVPAGAVLRAIRAALARELDERIDAWEARSGVPAGPGLGEPAFPASRAAIVAEADPVTVVICTRDRPDGLAVTLDGLVAQDHPGFQVIVVDSASSTGRTREVAESYAGLLDLRYLRHERPGLSRARNLGLSAVRTPVVAWLDDDATPDRYWLAELARGFATGPDVHVVSGSVVPRTLRRREQVWFEEFGGHSKGRGFTPAVFGPAQEQSPMYPLPAFGVGANMAFRTGALRAVGGFDEALGAGTRTKGGEDTRAFTEVMLAGGTMVYQPSALVRHDHRETIAALRAQLDGYGSGLTAYYTALLLRRPARLLALLRLAPGALRDLRGDSVRTATLGADFPPELMASNLRAMLRGPGRYLRQRLENTLLHVRDSVR